MSDLFAWLVIFQLMGLLATPLAFFLFRALPDRGYAFVKPLALLLAGYLLWVLGLSGILPNTPATIAAILVAGGAVFAWLYYRRWPELEEYLKAQWRYILVVEGLFLAALLAWAFIISEAPSINHTEKPMDFAFLSSILQSPQFPPEDPWLSGHSISYYYFGHFMMALPLKLAGITSNVGYNLAMATVPALVIATSFGLAYNLVRLAGGSFRCGILFGLFAPLLIAFTSNLEGVLELVQVSGWGSPEFWQWVDIKGLEGSSGTGFFPDSNWWWWRATRVIDTLQNEVSLDYTITEFPFFSFLLGDLHSHVLNLPFLTLVLALTLNLLHLPEPVGPRWITRHPWYFGALALALGSLAFVNSWDFPVFAGILAAAVLTRSLSHNQPPDNQDSDSQSPDNQDSDNQDSDSQHSDSQHSDSQHSDSLEESHQDFGAATMFDSLAKTAGLMAPLLILSVTLFLPFYVNLSSQVSGILPYTGPGTRPLHFLLVMGGPALFGMIFLWRQFMGWPRAVSREAAAIVCAIIVASLPLALWLALAGAWGALAEDIDSLPGLMATRTLTVMPLLAVAGLAGYAAMSRAITKRDVSLVFPLLLLAAAAYLVSGAELFHLADFFGNRMNTVFKVYYQAWVLLGIVGAFGVYYCFARFRSLGASGRALQGVLAGAAGLVLVAALYYPIGAALDRTGVFAEGHDFKANTLDGLAFIKAASSGEYAAIQWLRDEAEPGRLVEAVGDDYTEFGRVSAATGKPAVLGWKGHEHQWRGTTEAFQGREDDIAQIYQNPDPLAVYRILTYYDVRYVYLGHRERAKYGVVHPAAVDSVLETVFERDDVVVYEKVSYSPYR